jgi:hypothetical protein
VKVKPIDERGCHLSSHCVISYFCSRYGGVLVGAIVLWPQLGKMLVVRLAPGSIGGARDARRL